MSITELPDRAVPTDGPPRQPSTSRPTRILVVDDNPEVRRGTMRLLEQAGYAVILAVTGEEALRLAEETRPDLVLLDVQLPDLDGYEVCRRLKHSAAALEAPFVVHCSAQSVNPEHVAQGIQTGGDGYLARPVANLELLARVQGFLRHQTTLRQLRASERLFRSQFEQNPQPSWIVATDSRLVLTANAAAAQLYGYAPEELAGLPFARFFPDGQAEAFWPSSEAGVGPAQRGAFPQRRKSGSGFTAELLSHNIEWGGRPACAVLVTDISDRLELAAELARQRAGFDGEMRRLAAWSGAILPVTARALGVAPLSSAAPEVFAQLQAEYGQLLTLALRERVSRVEKEVSPRLRVLADRLCFLRAGPRDVIELHYLELHSRSQAEDPSRSQAYLEVGRQTVLELMGLLVAAYRHHAVGRPPPAFPGNERDGLI